MLSNEEINKKVNDLNKKIKKKIYQISTLQHKGLTNIRKILIKYAN